MKLALFDLDGTLIDSEAGIVNSIEYALGRLGAGSPPRETLRSVLGLNIGLVAFYLPLFYFFGWSNVLWVGLPVLHIASAAGGWLFFIQHQFEETTWDKAGGWDFQVAALLGSSYYKLPYVLNWFTGNIGLHHIHHLNSMIPNYRLMACLDASPELQAINKLIAVRDSSEQVAVPKAGV